MKKLLLLCFTTGAICCMQQQAYAQGAFLNKLKQKVENTANAALEKTVTGKDADNTTSTSPANTTSSKGRARNNSGEGLVTTPPDVKQHLAEAEGAYKEGTYGEARYAVQQAMLGVEMEIGQKILKSLPESINGLKKDAETDQVTSTGWGWAGLTILRQYSDQNEKEFRVTVANNSMLLSAVNVYLTNGGYSQTQGETQNWKQTKVKGHRAVIEFDQNEGYKLTVPLGQSSVLLYEGVNFKNEQEIMAAAGTVDIDGIKKMLGEK